MWWTSLTSWNQEMNKEHDHTDLLQYLQEGKNSSWQPLNWDLGHGNLYVGGGREVLLDNGSFWVLRQSAFRMKVHHQLSWFSGVPMNTENNQFPWLQPKACHRSWEMSAFKGQLFVINFIIHGPAFFWKTLTNMPCKQKTPRYLSNWVENMVTIKACTQRLVEAFLTIIPK